MHHGWAAIQATTSTPSRCSASVYSSSATPPELPVPRTSSRTQANPALDQEPVLGAVLERAQVVLAVRDVLQDRRVAARAGGPVDVDREAHPVTDDDAHVALDDHSPRRRHERVTWQPSIARRG